MAISGENAGVHGSMYPYIYTRSTGVHIVTPMDKSKVKTVLRGRTDAYDNYRRYEPVRDVGTDIVGQVRKGVIYDDSLNQGS